MGRLCPLSSIPINDDVRVGASERTSENVEVESVDLVRSMAPGDIPETSPDLTQGTAPAHLRARAVGLQEPRRLAWDGPPGVRLPSPGKPRKTTNQGKQISSKAHPPAGSGSYAKKIRKNIGTTKSHPTSGDQRINRRRQRSNILRKE